MNKQQKHYQVLIIGAGAAGIMTAARMRKKNSKLKIGLLDPAETHYYQPAWTLVGANTYDYAATARPMKSLIPDGVDWIKEYADKFVPESNKVFTKSKNEFTYDYLVVCPGIKIDPSLIEGLEESVGKGVVCSNYMDPEHTWEVLKNFKGGNALFTQPATPIKCGGAPQKAAYLSADYIRKHGLENKSQVIFAAPAEVIFGVKIIAETLMEVIHGYGIHFKPLYVPIKIDGKKQIATFKVNLPDDKFSIKAGNVINEKIVKNRDKDKIVEIPFNMLHIAPPQTAPDFVRNSPLAAESGWLATNKHTLQHPKYENVFCLGDAAELPTAKTGAAVRKQVPIVVANILKLMKDNEITNKKYNGYSSCPLVTGYGKMVLAEFDYDLKFIPDPKLKQLLVFNSNKEHWRLWMLKKYILPYLYWNKMVKGHEF